MVARPLPRATSAVTVWMLIAATTILILMLSAASAQSKQTRTAGHSKGFAGGIEAMVLYIRNEVIIPNVGHHGNGFVPFLLTLFFSPVVASVARYAPITAPALVIVGAMMMQNVAKIDWDDFSESIPAFLTIVGIPFFYSIADGLAFGFVSYPAIKLLGGRGREVKPLMYGIGALLVLYFTMVRVRI